MSNLSLENYIKDNIDKEVKEYKTIEDLNKYVKEVMKSIEEYEKSK